MLARNSRLNSFLITVDEGGVCAKFHEVQQTNETKEKEWRSHNTGVVNFAYNNNELPSQVVKLAFMHEIGHSLGSPVSNPVNQGCIGYGRGKIILKFPPSLRREFQNNIFKGDCNFKIR